MNDVTVVIPAHRETRRDWLEQAKNSFTKGTPVTICWNDGEVAEAFNEGVKAAPTEFVMLFSADDIAAPQMIEWLRGPAWNADLVYPSMTLVSEDLSQHLGEFPAQPFCPVRLQENNFVTGCSLVRRQSFLDIGGLDPTLESLEDWDLAVRMHRAGMRLKPKPEARLFYRQVAGSRNKNIDFHALRQRIVGDDTLLRTAKATFYNQSTAATTYLRCQLPARHLHGVVRPQQMAVHDEGNVSFPEHRGAAVYQFPGSQPEAAFSELMRDQGIRVLVETDDNYLSLTDAWQRQRSGWGVRIGQEPFTSQGHKAIVKRADGVIVTTQYLADLYRKHNPNVYVCPNSVDPADWFDPVDLDDGLFRVAWSGSLSHLRDAKTVARALEWASRQPGVQVVTHGVQPGWRFPHRHVAWDDDLDAYRTRMMAFDVAVCPVGPSTWEHCRSDVKALEMAMGMCCPILQDAPPYAEWTHMENCLKASDAKGFLRAVQWCVANKNEARGLARAAREYVLEKRTIQASIGCWEEAIAG